MNFDQAFDELLKHEGGYSDHPDDRGGKTRFGVTEAVAREVGYRGDMRELPLALAKRIARERYWDAVRADELPTSVRYAVFDSAYHSGPRQAIRWLQRTVGAREDGILGPQTLGLVRDANPDKLLRVFLAERLAALAGMSSWPAFGRGWARRIAAILEV